MCESRVLRVGGIQRYGTVAVMTFHAIGVVASWSTQDDQNQEAQVVKVIVYAVGSLTIVDSRSYNRSMY